MDLVGKVMSLLFNCSKTDTEAEAPIIWPPHAKSQLIGKDPDAGRDSGKRRTG